MGQSIKRFARNVTSQFGENGIIEEFINRVKPKPRYAIEFGAPTPQYCSNIYPLKDMDWAIAYFDIDPADIRIIKHEITPDNVNDLISHDISVLSIDCDGPDAGIWEAYTGTPDLVIIEINSSLDPDVDFFTPEKGANYSYMKKLAERKGYFLLCHTGNMLFVRNEHKDIFPDADETFVRDWLA